MKISYNWLKTLVQTELSPKEIADLLTECGLEVEGIEEYQSVKGGLKGVVIGKVLTCEKHPDADRLKLTTVDVGTQNPLQIVCGAPNVAIGQKVVVATVGSVLHTADGGVLEIKKSKIRGALSEGMICAEDEIGLGKSHDGIMVLSGDVPVGMPAAQYFGIEQDVVLEIGLTPNRSDAASHYGVARELAAILNVKKPEVKIAAQIPGVKDLPKSENDKKVQIIVRDKEGCSRYSGLVISGVKVGESPDWLKNRLNAIGVRPINNVVDITNFVLHETGQPMHAFDFDKIKGAKVVVETRAAGTIFKTLDGVERKLGAKDLMICNAEEPMCIAGVFGGEESGVSNETKNVFLESAFFNPTYIRRTAAHHGLKTDASFRFERGTDPEMTIPALKRAAHLIIDIAGGKPAMDIEDIYPVPLEPFKVAFSYTYLNEMAGKVLDKQLVKKILLELGIAIESEGNDGLLLLVPRYKTDVTRAADVAEEVIRIYGFNHIEPSGKITFSALNSFKNISEQVLKKVSSLLISQGFSEIMCLSLTKDAYYDDKENLVYVQNPLSSELNVMRKSMLYGGLETILYNINRRRLNLKFFETGKTYAKNINQDNSYHEQKHISIFLTGSMYPENYYGLNKQVDFYFLKAVVDELVKAFGEACKSVEVTASNEFDYAVKYIWNNKELVSFGSVSASVLRKLDIKQAVFYADFNFSLLEEIYSSTKVLFKELPLYPSVRRDLALVLEKSVTYRELEEAAFQAERKILKEVSLFDVYEGDKLAGKKSYALSFILQSSEATLTDKQVESVMEKLLKTYKEKFGAELR